MQSRPDLEPGNWDSLTSNVAGNGGTITITNGLEHNRVFYPFTTD